MDEIGCILVAAVFDACVCRADCKTTVIGGGGLFRATLLPPTLRVVFTVYRRRAL